VGGLSQFRHLRPLSKVRFVTGITRKLTEIPPYWPFNRTVIDVRLPDAAERCVATGMGAKQPTPGRAECRLPGSPDRQSNDLVGSEAVAMLCGSECPLRPFLSSKAAIPLSALTLPSEMCPPSPSTEKRTAYIPTLAAIRPRADYSRRLGSYQPLVHTPPPEHIDHPKR
jgi:hypothetical protein